MATAGCVERPIPNDEFRTNPTEAFPWRLRRGRCRVRDGYKVRTMEAELMPFTNAEGSDGGAMTWVRGAPTNPHKIYGN